ncbi:MAG: putative addiction module antidote protein [Alteromonadaceae bacterium]|nr:putative addiction module antidote protein [Alteromonadaceae bacterium]
MAINQEAVEKYGVRPFDVAEYLDSDEMIVAYLSEILAEGDMDELLEALGEVARAKGMSKLAEDTGLGRESMYKALAPGAKPRFDTVSRVLRGLGVSLRAEPVGQKTAQVGIATRPQAKQGGGKAAKPRPSKDSNLQHA